MPLIVQKYGGTSVGDLKRVAKVAQHIADTVARGNRVVVVVSAMSGYTDNLVSMANTLNQKSPKRELDMLMSSGERISMALLSIALDQLQVRAISLTGSQSGILTDGFHGNARVKKISGERIISGLEKNAVVIVAGFQGVCPETKEITTLGRGGSDLSAIAIAIALKAHHCEIYTDVRGVYSGHPDLIPHAKPLPHLSWQTMNQMSWAGAKVLHHRGAHLAKKYELPVKIRSSMEFSDKGTQVQGYDAMESSFVKAMAHQEDQSYVQAKLKSSANAASQSLEWLWSKEESPLIFRQQVDDQGLTSLQCLMSSRWVQDFIEFLHSLDNAVSVRVTRDLASISLIGSGFRQNPELLSMFHQTMKAPPQLMETQDTSLTCCIPMSQLNASLQDVHRQFFEKPPM